MKRSSSHGLCLHSVFERWVSILSFNPQICPYMLFMLVAWSHLWLEEASKWGKGKDNPLEVTLSLDLHYPEFEALAIKLQCAYKVYAFWLLLCEGFLSALYNAKITFVFKFLNLENESVSVDPAACSYGAVSVPLVQARVCDTAANGVFRCLLPDCFCKWLACWDASMQQHLPTSKGDSSNLVLVQM